MSTNGQIVRIKCENLLTYNSIEIYPCSKLNLIIGANGSGKSTIISAIILGLGGNPQIAGRATELCKYVKVGYKRASIEIELHNDNGDNHVIRREFDSHNRSRFLINSTVVSLEKVQKLVERHYRIQINNLCQILPQEKLESFAKMNDQERLSGTLKTVGEITLSKNLDALKKNKVFEAIVRKKIECLRGEFAELKTKRDMMEQEVRMIKEKQFLVDSLQLLRQRRAWAVYFHLDQTIGIIDEMLTDKKTVYQNMVKVLNRITSDMQSSQSNALNQKNISGEVYVRFNDQRKLVRAKQEAITSSVEGIRDKKREFKQTLNKFKTQDAEIRDLKRNIGELENEQNNVSQATDNRKQLESERLMRRHKLEESQRAKDDLSHALRRKRNELNAVNSRLSRMEDLRERKMDIIRKDHEDCAKAIEWLNQNRSLFRGQIFEPMFMHLNVINPDNAKYVENCVRLRDLIAFICEYREDANIFLEQCKERYKLRINVVTAVQCRDDDLRPPVPIEHLRQYGFHSYVSDFISGPEIIVRYLTVYYGLNRIPVGNEYTFTVSDKIPNTFRTYFTDKFRISVKVGTFSGKKIESSSEIRRAQLLGGSVDDSDREKLLAEKLTMMEELKTIETQYHEYEKTTAEGEEMMKQLMDHLRILNIQQRSQSQVGEKLKELKRRLNLRQNNVIDVETERKKCNATIKLTMNKVCNMYLELAKIMQKLTELYVEYQRAQLDARQAMKIHENNLVIMRRFVNELKTEVESLRQLELKKKKLEKITARLKHWALKFTKKIDPRKPEFPKRRMFFKLTDNVPLLGRLINRFQAKVNCLGTANDGVEIYKRYMELAKKTSHVAEKIEIKEQKLKEFQEEIANTKVKWLDNVNTLISQINENFQRFFASMNCAGEVSLFTGTDGDDFNQYGIHIKVKFREESDLQILNAQTQSGGERAVSVAIYLLSLQELTTVPFRCIDEINQGMDADNERRIFNLITQATEERCQTQYFLLTPKLLPRLNFTPNCKIFCPYNGVGSVPHEKFSQIEVNRNSMQSID